MHVRENIPSNRPRPCSRLSDSVFRTLSLPNRCAPRVPPGTNYRLRCATPSPLFPYNITGTGATLACLLPFHSQSPSPPNLPSLYSNMNGAPFSAFAGGESSSSRRHRRLPLFPPTATATEELSNFDAMFSGVSLQSLLLDKPLSSSPSPFSSSYSTTSSSSSSPLWSPLASPVSRYPPSPEQQQQLPFHYSPSPLKMPKQEPRYSFPDFVPGSAPLDSPSLADDSTLCIPLHSLSDLLRSLETLQQQPPQLVAATAAGGQGPARKRPADPERTKRAKEKRLKINQCLRQLHDLVMPQAERRMDTLTTLEEACKHVAYMQQLVKSALHLVPRESPPPTPYIPTYCPADDGDGGDGMLGRLRMQHLLERKVNSLPAQSVLCDREYGVAAAAASTNQQWQWLKQHQEEEAAATEMRMEMQQQMWLNLEAHPNQSPL